MTPTKTELDIQDIWPDRSDFISTASTTVVDELYGALKSSPNAVEILGERRYYCSMGKVPGRLLC